MWLSPVTCQLINMSLATTGPHKLHRAFSGPCSLLHPKHACLTIGNSKLHVVKLQFHCSHHSCDTCRCTVQLARSTAFEMLRLQKPPNNIRMNEIIVHCEHHRADHVYLHLQRLQRCNHVLVALCRTAGSCNEHIGTAQLYHPAWSKGQPQDYLAICATNVATCTNCRYCGWRSRPLCRIHQASSDIYLQVTSTKPTAVISYSCCSNFSNTASDQACAR